MSDRDCPYCYHTSDSHCGDVADQIRANGGTPGNGICSNAQVYGMRPKTERPGSWDQRAFTTAQAILAIEGNDSGQLSARVQLAVLDAMQWAAHVVAAKPSHCEIERLRAALAEAEAALEFACARNPIKSRFIPSEHLGLRIIRDALKQAPVAPADHVATVHACHGTPSVRLEWASVEAAHNAIPGPLYSHASPQGWRLGWNEPAATPCNAAPVAPAFAPSPECDSPRICSTAKTCAGLFGTKRQCGAPVAPAGRHIPPALVAALRFYAQRQHFVLADSDAWDTVSGEPANFWEDEANTATVEDGSIARVALEGLESMPTQAAVEVLAERSRQTNVLGWTPEHDDEHDLGELSSAAAAYAIAAADKLNPMSLGDGNYTAENPPLAWPTERQFKPTDPRRMLVKAAALLLAEIERLDRSGKGTAA